MTQICQVAPPDARKPRFTLPVGATDTHFHVFGPATEYPYVPTREYTPPEALPSSIERLYATVGIERAVLIQATVYGRDNRRHLDAVQQMGIPTRVIIVTGADTPIQDLERMHQQGARGVRFVAAHPGGLPLEELEPMARKLKGLGWHIQFMLRPETLVELEDRLAALSCPAVIDHLGMIDPWGGLSQPAVQALLRLVRGGNCWVKLSGFYRVSRQNPPYSDVDNLVRALVAAAPDRMVWGSDWPHPLFSGRMPNLTDVIEPLWDWIPDAAIRRRILVDNPAQLYGFDPVMPTHLDETTKAGAIDG